MTTDTDEVQLLPSCHDGASAIQKEIHETVFLALQSRQTDATLDRRTALRRPFPYPIYLTPPNGAVEDTITVLGKHISEQGLDFYSNEALPHRKVTASIDLGDGHWVAMELTLNWCRFGRHGWYENGGKFTRTTESPIGETPLGNSLSVQEQASTA